MANAATNVKQNLLWLVAFVFIVAIGIATFYLRSGDLSVAPQMVQVTNSANQKIYVQKYEITVEEWNKCFDDDACSLKIKTKSNQTADKTPATGVNWLDIQEYLTWINKKTHHKFRLPTSPEWNALAKEVLPEKPAPLFSQPELSWASAYLTTPKHSRKLFPTGNFDTTKEGLTDLDGNVWEWTSTCYDKTIKNTDKFNCPAYEVGGEHLAVIPIFTRDPAVGGCAVGIPPAHLGLRLVTDKPIQRP